MSLIKDCQWQWHDILINTLRHVYICKTCGYKRVLEHFEEPPTISSNNKCYENE